MFAPSLALCVASGSSIRYRVSNSYCTVTAIFRDGPTPMSTVHTRDRLTFCTDCYWATAAASWPSLFPHAPGLSLSSSLPCLLAQDRPVAWRAGGRGVRGASHFSHHTVPWYVALPCLLALLCFACALARTLARLEEILIFHFGFSDSSKLLGPVHPSAETRVYILQCAQCTYSIH